MRYRKREPSSKHYSSKQFRWYQDSPWKLPWHPRSSSRRLVRLHRPRRRWYAIALADVSGKGMPAALLMSPPRHSALPLAGTSILRRAKRFPARLNQTLSETFRWAIVTMNLHRCRCPLARNYNRSQRRTSAVHCSINGECAFLDVDTGLPLGNSRPYRPIRNTKITLKPGTRLLFIRME